MTKKKHTDSQYKFDFNSKSHLENNEKNLSKKVEGKQVSFNPRDYIYDRILNRKME